MLIRKSEINLQSVRKDFKRFKEQPGFIVVKKERVDWPVQFVRLKVGGTPIAVI